MNCAASLASLLGGTRMDNLSVRYGKATLPPLRLGNPYYPITQSVGLQVRFKYSSMGSYVTMSHFNGNSLCNNPAVANASAYRSAGIVENNY